MAEQPIKSTDIIESGLFNDAIKSADLFIEKAKEVETQLKNNLSASKNFLSGFSVGNSKDLSALSNETNKIAASLKNLETVQKSIIVTEKNKLQIEKELERQRLSEIKLNKEREKAFDNFDKQQKKNLETQFKLNSVYEQTKQRYNELSKAQIELSARGRENGVVFKAVKAEADALRATLDKAEQGAGRFQRNVGNYASTFNGLGNSVNQLTRELPAFAVSANTGFLAISNNLPIFFDQLTRIKTENEALIKQGKPVESVFSQLGKAVFSVSSLLSISVTLLTLYGAKLAETVVNLFRQSDAFDLNKEAMAAYNEELERTQKAQDSVDKSIQSLQKQYIKNAKLVTDFGEVQLEAADKLSDRYAENEKERIKQISKIVTEQLKAGDKEAEIQIKNTGRIIEFKNKETNEIIRLDAKGKQVQQKIYNTYAEGVETANEKAIQKRLDTLNFETKALEQKYLDEYNLAIDSEKSKGEGTKKIRQKFSDEDYIKKKSDLDKIRQLEIDSLEDSRFKEEEQIRFDNEKAVREIDLANEVEKEKLRIAKVNYLQQVEITKANVENEEQRNIDLLKLTADYNKQVKQIEAENISKDEQRELRYQLEVNLRKKLLDVEEKYQKELAEKVKTDLNKTYNARIKQNEELEQEEISLLEDAYNTKKSKRKIFDAAELNDLNTTITEKKKLLIQEQADEKKALTENYAEKQQIQTEADIKKRDLDKKLAKEKKQNQIDDLKQAAEFSSQVLDLIAKEEAEKSRLKQESFDKQISDTEQNIETQRRLAEKGKANTLAEEEARKAQLERQKQIEKEEEIKRQKVLAFFKLYSAYAENDPDNALQKALKDTILAEAVAAAFIDGTENVAQDPQFSKHKYKNGQDGYIARFDGRERILNPEQNAKIGNMSNDDLANLAYMSNKGLLETAKYAAIPSSSFAENVANSALLMETVALKKEMQEIKEAIKSRPVSNFTLDGYGNFISETIENGFKKVTTHKIKKPRLG